VRALPDLIRPWVARRFVALGTDGYGRSDTRERLRNFFGVSAQHIVLAALRALVDEEKIPASAVADAITRYGIAPADAHPWER